MVSGETEGRGRGWGHTGADTLDKLESRNLREQAILLTALVVDLAGDDVSTARKANRRDRERARTRGEGDGDEDNRRLAVLAPLPPAANREVFTPTDRILGHGSVGTPRCRRRRRRTTVGAPRRGPGRRGHLTGPPKHERREGGR